MESHYSKPAYTDCNNKGGMKMAMTADNDRSTAEFRALDCNLAALCDHIQMDGFDSGAFSDIVIQVMGSTYRLHRLILSRSSYFRIMHHIVQQCRSQARMKKEGLASGASRQGRS